MAETILYARDSIPLNKPVLVSSCDISFIIDYKKFYTLIKKILMELFLLGGITHSQMKVRIHMLMLK